MHFQPLFKQFFNDEANSKPAAEYIVELRQNISHMDLFSESVITNRETFAKLHEQLRRMMLSHCLHVGSNARYAVKIAHILYSGDEFENIRNYADKQVMLHLKFRKNASTSSQPPISQTRQAPVNPNIGTVRPETTRSNECMQPMANVQKQMCEMMKEKELSEILTTQTSHEPLVGNRDAESNRSRTSNTSESRTHIDVASRFKNKVNKYSGSEEENFQEFLT